MCVCVCACVRACVRVCVCVILKTCLHMVTCFTTLAKADYSENLVSCGLLY